MFVNKRYNLLKYEGVIFLRTVRELNDFWRFTKLPAGMNISKDNVISPEYEDASWLPVVLPHTYNSEDSAGRMTAADGGNYYRGTVCYRRNLALSFEECSGKELYLEFEGANTVAEVYINGRFAGEHSGGYSAFRFDITDYIYPDKDNLIAVIVSNAPTDYIAPITDNGDFTKMGGLYRGVKLIAVEPVHIALKDSGSCGVYITPRNISETSADIGILVKLDKAETAEAKAVIYDPQGKPVTEFFGRADKDRITLSGKINCPKFWDGVSSPSLYRAEITLFCNRKPVDSIEQEFGIRSYLIDADNGFFLNGKPYPLHGVNYHQDSYESGWAMTDAQRERDYHIIRDMGCTAVRMAHYQHCDHEYSLCDRLGLCVWTEIGIINKMSADESDAHVLSDGFGNNAKQQLRELIRQNYNHPSVIVWGLSNELHQMTDEIFGLYSELYEIACKEDDTRLKTFADNQFYGRFLELPADVVGYNRYFGWYKEAGSAENFGEWLDLYHNEKEKRPVCLSEYGGGGAISQHKDNVDWESDIDPVGVRHYENYQSQLHEILWKQFSVRKYLWAEFIWCMFDFASYGRTEGDTKSQNDKGLCTRERIPKDVYFFYRSVWSSEKTVYITERRHEFRACDVPFVKVYSNADAVELCINDVSYGRISRCELLDDESTVFVWENIKIKPDTKNKICAKAYFSDGTSRTDYAFWTGK